MVKINPIIPSTLALQTFAPEDFAIIPNSITSSEFNPSDNVIEYFIYDYNNNLLTSNNNLTSFTPIRINSEGEILEISLNPENDAINEGFDSGIIKTIYNFINYELNSSPGNLFYISEISPSRTEIRLNTNNILDFEFPDVDEDTGELVPLVGDTLFPTFTSFKEKLENETYFDEFYLNFNNNILILGVNILLEVDRTNQTVSLLVKLYEPLPSNIGPKTELYIVTKPAESVGYQLEFEQTIEVTDDLIPLSGPNYNINIKDQTGPTTVYKNYSDITTTSLSGSFSELMNNISQSSINVNVDYTDYENFVFFSSAKERLINFKNKITSISSSQALLDNLYNITGSTSSSMVISSSKNLYEKQIQDQITSFDGYEKYLYYNSGSKSWPKSNSTKPYILFDPTSSQAVNWYSSQSITASNFDNQNQNNLEYIIPSYIRDDSRNENYLLYTNMIGQFFDEIWLYTKEITSKLDANSNLTQGISKDLVGTVLESLGTKIYDSSYTLENIYSSLIGLSADGSTSPSTGSEYITNYVTSSIDENQVPTIDDFVKLSYKKIYHSLPYLLKKKGTNQGLRALVNLFGIPDTILRISEFGGKDKINVNDWDHWQNTFNYKYDTVADGIIETEWPLNTNWSSRDNIPHTVQFRFQMPPSSSNSLISQSLWSLDDGSEVKMVLEYDRDFTSGSYSGSIIDPENQYANLWLYTNADSSGSIRLPFFDSGWWSVMIVQQDQQEFFDFYAANKIYNGKDGHQIGFIASSSVTASSALPWTNAGNSYFPSQAPIGSYTNFSGSYQEIRYFASTLTDSIFRDYTMNPNSIEGLTPSSSSDQLAFRASLGGELYTGSVSIHPKITGSEIINSFTSDSNFTITGGEFSINREIFFYDQIPAGVKNIVSNKVKQLNTDLPYTGSLSNTTPNTILSNQIQVQQNVVPSSSYVKDINYLEVAFSPQNEINEDINSSMGYFNIGDYIGDPRQISSSAESYPDLDTLRDDYFGKYYTNYNLWDYIRIINYYDNALFKMVKDFVPARTSLATGIVIKQHILERNKYPTPQLNTDTTSSFTYLISGSGNDTLYNIPNVFQNLEITGSSIVTNTVTGSNGGSMPSLGGATSSVILASGSITQSWSGINDTIAGPVSYTASSQHEFFDGELSGSNFIVTNGELNPGCDNLKESSTIEILYSASFVPHTLALNFLNRNIGPGVGEIYLLHDSSSAI
jgi:hypothetical protein